MTFEWPITHVLGYPFCFSADPVNTRSYVAMMLATILPIRDAEAFQVMDTAHREGKGTLGPYSREHAEMYISQLTMAGLTVDTADVTR